MTTNQGRVLTATMVAVAVLILVTILAGCGSAGSPSTPAPTGSGYFRVVKVDVNGRPVTCVSWKQGYAGGLSCDWASAR